VDFDHSLNTSINRLRQALRDDAENPRFVATVGRLGYRFIAPTAVAGNGHSKAADEDAPPPESSSSSNEQSTSSEARFGAWRVAVVLGITAVLAAAVISAHRLLTASPVRVLDIVRVSHNTKLDPWGRVNTDGARLFFMERAGDHWNLMQVPATGGDAVPFSETYRNMRVVSISPDRSQFLASTFAARVPDLPLWIVPIVGGPPRRVGNIKADDAIFTPDGREITFNGPDGIYQCERNGANVRKLVSLPGRSSHPAWSRDGQRLRFTLFDEIAGTNSLWEVTSEGENLHPIVLGSPFGVHDRSGRWSPDGRYFFFESTQGDNQTVWVVRDAGNPWLAEAQKPVQLTFGPNSYGLPVPDDTGHSVYVWGGQEHRDAVIYDKTRGSFEALLPNLKLGWFAFSPDGSQLAFSHEGTLLLGRSDGSEQRPLVSEFAKVGRMVWSPDGQRILFAAQRVHEYSWKFFAIKAEGGAPVEIVLTPGALDPVWSADGGSIFYSGRVTSGADSVSQGDISILDLNTSTFARIRGSENLDHPSASPDGRFLAAISEVRSGELTRLELYDLKTETWKEVARGTLLSGSSWSRDSKYLYYQDLLAPDEPVFRYDPETRTSKRALDFAPLLGAGAIRCGFNGLSPDGSILAVITHGDGDLYRIDLELP
jgi:Tol biopolymer transport system component